MSECKCVCGNCKQDLNKTGVYGADTTDALQSWQTEIINKEIEDRYRENQDPFGEHFSINPNSAKENE